jgi:MutL C terminal dimerisation domain
VFNKAHFRAMRIHGQFNLGFIMASIGSELFIIDQHAADEKYNFERLRDTTVLNKCALCTMCLGSTCFAASCKYSAGGITGDRDLVDLVGQTAYRTSSRQAQSRVVTFGTCTQAAVACTCRSGSESGG